MASSKRSSATAPSPMAAARSLSPPSPFSLASAASLSRWMRACRTARASRSMCTRCFRETSPSTNKNLASTAVGILSRELPAKVASANALMTCDAACSGSGCSEYRAEMACSADGNHARPVNGAAGWRTLASSLNTGWLRSSGSSSLPHTTVSAQHAARQSVGDFFSPARAVSIAPHTVPR